MKLDCLIEIGFGFCILGNSKWFLKANDPNFRFFYKHINKKLVRKLCGRLQTSKMVGFCWNFAHLILGWISEWAVITFWKFWFLGPGDEFFAKTRLPAWRRQKWSDFAEILHTFSLDEYLTVLYSLFENFDFLGLGTSFSPKRGWQPGDAKNVRIWMKFCTLVLWINIWGWYFHFLKILIL